MKKTKFDLRKELAIAEFEFIIKKYILPLLDTKGNLKFHDQSEYNNQLIKFSNENNTSTVIFYPCVSAKNKPSPFNYSIQIYSSSALKKRAESILRELLKVAEFNCLDFSKQRDYGKKTSQEMTYKIRTLDIAFEIGMCKWLTEQETEATILHTLICRLIEWTSKTYEGKKVPFGIIIDFDKTADKKAADYLHFLQNDSSAVFSDGIFSGILLDKTGKVLSFLTKDTNNEITTSDNSKEIFVPFQFADIAKYCKENSIGVIALSNGEIIIIKNQSICFAKRGSKWIAFDWTRVYEKMRPYFLLNNKDEKEIKRKLVKIYCTLLDVSFSHTGGCLSIVIPSEENNINEVINERIDLLAIGSKIEGISQESKEKIEILTYLLTYPESRIRSFFEIEKPLRKEILSLDGATVVSTNGNFYCAGSIVSVPSGSSGGGRTAATKKLSNYGIGIKISEDGYIEAYGKNINSNTPRIIPLFKFK